MTGSVWMRSVMVIPVCALTTLGAIVGPVGASEAEEFFRQGYKAFVERDWNEAIKWYDRSIQLDPRNPEVYVQRAIAYETINKLDQAIADYRRALKLKPDYYLAMEYLGNLYTRTGEYTRAINMYSRALTMVHDPKWRAIIQWWISEVQKKREAARESANRGHTGE